MTAALIIIGFLCVVGGAVSLSGATAGVGAVAIGCFLAILARLAQARTQHAELLKAHGIESAANKPKPLTITCPSCNLTSPRGPSACPGCGEPFAAALPKTERT